MMACSIGVQAANLWALRNSIQWGGSLLLIIGGALHRLDGKHDAKADVDQLRTIRCSPCRRAWRHHTIAELWVEPR
jgi:hypothetical protein